jgi:hypothetical protein
MASMVEKSELCQYGGWRDTTEERLHRVKNTKRPSSNLKMSYIIWPIVPIMGAVKESNGETYEYPYLINFFP